jgi:hypothetical protein
MRIPPIERTADSHVRAVFATSTSSLDLSRTATFEELADRLSRLGEHHDGPLIGISIERDPSQRPRSIRTAVLRRLADAGVEVRRAGF